MSKHRQLIKQLKEVEDCLIICLTVLGDSSNPVTVAEDALRDVENLKVERQEILNKLSLRGNA